MKGISFGSLLFPLYGQKCNGSQWEEFMERLYALHALHRTSCQYKVIQRNYTHPIPAPTTPSLTLRNSQIRSVCPKQAVSLGHRQTA